MKTIIVPIDFSPIGKRGLDFALLYAKENSSRLILVNAWNMPQAPASDSLMLSDEIEKRQNQLMTELVDFIKQNSSSDNLKVEWVVKNDNAVHLIKLNAKKYNADLIIMGTEGSSGIKELVLGSKAGSVMEGASCPVIAIPNDHELKFVKHVAFASNFDLNDIKRIKLIFKWFKPLSVSVIHVGDPQYRDMNQFEDFVLDLKQDFAESAINYYYLNDADIEQGIQNFIDKNQIDMICFSIRRHTFFQQVFNKSLTKRMTYHTQIPLIAFPLNQMSEDLVKSKKYNVLSQNGNK